MEYLETGYIEVKTVLGVLLFFACAGGLWYVLARFKKMAAKVESPLPAVEQALGEIYRQKERNDLVRVLLHQATELTNAEYAGVLLPKEGGSMADIWTIVGGEMRVDTVTLVLNKNNVASGRKLFRQSEEQPRGRLSLLPVLPPYYSRVKNVYGTPMESQGKLFGELFLVNKPTGFSLEDESVVEMLARFGTFWFQNDGLVEQIKRGYMATIEALVQTIEAKDPYTRGHSERVTKYAVAIAEDMGFTPEQIEEIRTGAVLHDIGKIGVSEAIINKDGPLTEEEMAQMRTHPRLGTRIIDSFNRSQEIMLMVYHHHESFDGTGYPAGLRGNDIPLAARILKVADSFEAMTSQRSYQQTKSFEEALQELRDCAGQQFDPQIVAAFHHALLNPSYKLDEVFREAQRIIKQPKNPARPAQEYELPQTNWAAR